MSASFFITDTGIRFSISFPNWHPPQIIEYADAFIYPVASEQLEQLFLQTTTFAPNFVHLSKILNKLLKYNDLSSALQGYLGNVSVQARKTNKI